MSLKLQKIGRLNDCNEKHLSKVFSCKACNRQGLYDIMFVRRRHKKEETGHYSDTNATRKRFDKM